MHLLKQKIAIVCAKRARRKEARPGELLAAALHLFVEKGFAATRAEEVAALAGVSKGTLFLYFESKDALFKAVVRDSLAGRFGEWAQELHQFEGSSAEMLRFGLSAWWQRLGSTQAAGICKLVMSEAQNFPDLARFYHEEVIVPGHGLLQAILQRGVDRGEFQIEDMNHTVYTVIAPMIYLMTWKHSLGLCPGINQAMDPEKFVAKHIEIALHGLLKRT